MFLAGQLEFIIIMYNPNLRITAQNWIWRFDPCGKEANRIPVLACLREKSTDNELM